MHLPPPRAKRPRTTLAVAHFSRRAPCAFRVSCRLRPVWRGRIDFYDGGVAAPLLAARLGPLALALAGGVYDWQAPSFRLGVAARRASLAQARDLFAFSARLPVSGPVRLRSLVEGRVGDPLVMTSVWAPALHYGAFPATRARARVAYLHGAVDIVGGRGDYGGLDVAVGGAIDIGANPRTQLVAGVRGSAEHVPYLAQAAPGTQFEVSALLAGVGTRLAAYGSAAAQGAGARVAGVFRLSELGDGPLGPLLIEKADGSSLAGTFYANRSASTSGFWLDARRFAFARPARPPHLPGLALAPPQFAGTLDGSLAGLGPPSAFRVAGRVRARDVRVGAFTIDAADGLLAGAFGNFSLGAVRANGTWGTFRGHGAYVGARLALSGDYRGSFEQLASLTGDLGAKGPVRGPVALLIDPRQTLVQARGDDAAGTRVHGIALDSLSGTLAVRSGALKLYAGTAALGGGSLAAAGALGGAAGVGISLGGLSGARVGGKLPFEGGRIGVIGTLDGSAARTRFTGGVVLAGAGIDRLPLAVNGEARFAGARLLFASTDATVGSAVGWLDGSVDAFGSSAARYGMALHLTAARLAPFARAAAPERTDVSGTLAGDFHVAGTPGALALDGDLRVPEGTLNGLAFREGFARLRLDSGGIVARGGRLTVGSTQAAFDAAFRGNDAALRIDLPRADLSDFDDLFDAGDLVGGRGRIAARFVKRGNAEFTTAQAAVAGLRYRRFDLGDTRVGWTSQGANVRATAAFGGTSGRLEAGGTLVLARDASLAELLRRSRFDGNAHLRGLDLGVWLPALGYQVPLGGRVDADAAIVGPLRNPDITTRATLMGGSFGRFPIDRLTLAATSTLYRTTVTSAELALPSLAATLSGSFGLRPRDPLALAIHVKSPDVGALAARAYGATELAGAAEMDVKVTGTRASPRVSGGFDVENARLRGVAIPRALGEFNVRGRDLVLSDVEVGFATGTLYFAGSVPLEIAPLGLGPPQAPITLELAAKGLDLADFRPLLPSGSTLGGHIDGRVAVSGTAGAPRLEGRLDLADGAFRSPAETVPLTRLRAALRFQGDAARLEGLHAEAGGGTFDAAGSASFANLGHSGNGGAYALSARANRLRLNLPAYGSGQIDGAVALSHAPSRAPALTGHLALSDSTIPFSALLFSNGAAGVAAESAPGPVESSAADVAFDLTLQAARNVHVRSANLDIGARGDLHVGGTRSAPELAGTFTSTGGTLSYFNTVFRLTEGSVAFSPERGLIPTLEAQATTHVIDPDPNSVRNVSGAADITLAVSGPLTGLNIGLSSYPAYDREQILGLLLNAPALGATNLFGERTGPTLYGSNSPSPLPPGVIGRGSGAQFSVAQQAFGIANAQFTRTLLAPIESTFASAVGLSSFNVNVDYTGNVGLTARKVLGRKLNALYGTSFGYPYRQTFGFEFKPNDAAAAQVTVFQTLGAAGLDSLAPLALTAPNQRLQAAQPATGTIGFSLSLQRLYP